MAGVFDGNADELVIAAADRDAVAGRRVAQVFRIQNNVFGGDGEPAFRNGNFPGQGVRSGRDGSACFNLGFNGSGRRCRRRRA